MIDVITGVTTAIEITKKIKEVSDKTKTAETSLLIVSLMEQLIEVKSSSLYLKEENLKLREELLELKKESEKEELIFNEDVRAYFSKDGDGPFCPGCYDSRNGLRVRMLKHGTKYGNHYKCTSKDCRIQISFK